MDRLLVVGEADGNIGTVLCSTKLSIRIETVSLVSVHIVRRVSVKGNVGVLRVVTPGRQIV